MDAERRSDESGGSEDDRLTSAALAARSGDPEAVRALVVGTQRQLRRMLAHLADPAVADDLTQETYERALAALPRFRGESSARTWLLTIARRVAADHLRRLRRRPVVAAALDLGDREPAASGDHAERVALDAVLGLLSADRREAFVLTQLIGLDYRDAAAVVGCPIGTIRSRVARARADLVAMIDGADEVDDVDRSRAG